MLAEARADTTRLLGAAEAEAEAARMAAYDGVDRAVLFALAAREAAAHLPQIGSLTLTPDAITSALNALSVSQDNR